MSNIEHITILWQATLQVLWNFKLGVLAAAIGIIYIYVTERRIENE